MLVDNITTRVVEQLNAGNSFGGFGCLLKKHDELVPLQFAEKGQESSITPEFYKRLLQALQEEITAKRAVATGIASEGNISLEGEQVDAIIINIYHEILENEAITYVIPYTRQASEDVVLMENEALLEFNEM